MTEMDPKLFITLLEQKLPIVAFDICEFISGGWMIDIVLKEQTLVAEWRPAQIKYNYGLSSITEDTMYGDGVDECYMDAESVISRICYLNDVGQYTTKKPVKC